MEMHRFCRQNHETSLMFISLSSKVRAGNSFIYPQSYVRASRGLLLAAAEGAGREAGRGAQRDGERRFRPLLRRLARQPSSRGRKNRWMGTPELQTRSM